MRSHVAASAAGSVLNFSTVRETQRAHGRRRFFFRVNAAAVVVVIIIISKQHF